MIGLETANTVQRHKPNWRILRVRQILELSWNFKKKRPEWIDYTLRDRPRQLRS